MANPIYAIYGASGCGRSLMPVARQQLEKLGIKAQLLFIDDGLKAPGMINGQPAVNYQEFLNLEGSKSVCIGIASSRVREKLFERLSQDNIDHWSIYADNHVCMDEVRIGPGSAISPFVSFGANVKIGQAFHANLYSYVEHDCIIGDFVTFAPRVSCNGNVIIEDHAYIGTGAVIRQGTPEQPIVIGRGAIVGMGAVVTKSVPAGVTVVGNPARPLVKT